MNEELVEIDIAILGGGIAGLWALNRMRKLGFRAILLEKNALGSGQTIKSQGIIHGGVKYALKGFLNASANAVETMPRRWRGCLEGSGEIDCRNVKILSNTQLLWSTGSISSEITGFFASKSLSSRVQKLTRNEYPPVLQNPAFKGHAYCLEEVVLDTSSLIETLAKPHQEFIFKINENQGYELLQDVDNPLNVLTLKLRSGNEILNIKAKRYLLTAGEGNEQILHNLPSAPLMQRRPLQMVMVKLAIPSPFFAHCMDNGINPRVTITTHQCNDGKSVWYIGGQIAEDGVTRSQSEQIDAAKKELKTLFPWMDFTHAQWASFFVNRAEPKQLGGKRPENAFIQALGNIMVAWPTKLALSPLLSDQILNILDQQEVIPSTSTDGITKAFQNFEKPVIALPSWNEAIFQY